MLSPLSFAPIVIHLAIAVPSETLRVPEEYSTIQGAINAAVDGDVILVSPNTYHERINLLGKAITLKSTGSACNAIIDGTGVGQPFQAVVNCIQFEDSDTIIQGFTITGGNNGIGAGMRNYGASPTVIHCRFVENNAGSGSGGGMFNQYYPNPLVRSNPLLIDCEFINNSAGTGGGLANSQSNPKLERCTFQGNLSSQGGAVNNNLSSNASFVDCVFRQNQSTSAGGGFFNQNSGPDLVNCEFIGNTATIDGGGVYTANTNTLRPKLTNCLLVGNTAGGNGGGLYACCGNGGPIVKDCTFSQNHANGPNFPPNPAFLPGGAVRNQSLNFTMANCVLWNDTPQEIGGTGSGSVTFSIVSGSPVYPGSQNTNANPQFVGSASQDFHIKATSPARDTGSNAAVPSDTQDLDDDGNVTEKVPLDLGGLPRFVPLGGGVDRGAYKCLVDPCTGAVVEELTDCNANLVPDSCDILSGSSPDCNSNGVPDECEVDPTIDVIFILDGSGSISEDAFGLQLTGIQECLCGPNAIVPIDGSASVAVIQFTDVECEEITLQRIDSPQDAQDLCDSIGAIQQVEGNTELLPALNKAFDIFNVQGTGTLRQLFITTDGGITDQVQSLDRCEDMRTNLGVKVCTGLVDEPCPPAHVLLLQLGNVDDPANPTFDPHQPIGSYRCVTEDAEFGALCTTCIVLEADCDANGIPDSCEPDCDGDRVPDVCEADVNGNHFPDDCETCFGDITLDGVINVSDLLALLAAWGPCPPQGPCMADLNGDGQVTVNDQLLLLATPWGPCP